MATSMYVTAKSVASGTMSLGDFVLVNAYVLQIIRPLEVAGFALRDIAQGMAFVEKMVQLLSHPREQNPTSEQEHLRMGRAELIFDKVCLSFDHKTPVLQDISFTVPAGGTVAIIGPSGAGKSSILRLILRMWEPSSGRIFVDGTPLTQISAHGLRESIAIVPQDVVLFDDSITYNISFGRAASSFEDIVRASRLAGVHDFIMSQPLGYQTRVGERGLKLSGGERQRIAIARAVLMQPRIYLFDEVTASLDAQTESDILSSLRAIIEGITTIIVTHRQAAVLHADQVVLLRDGRIATQGTHQTLLRDDPAYASFWLRQDNGTLVHDVSIQPQLRSS